MNKTFSRAAILVLLLGGAATTLAQMQTVVADTLNGKVIDGEPARELIGHVLLTQENTRVTCDRALQYMRTGKFFLSGNVVVTDDSMTLRAPRGSYYQSERRAEAFDSVYLDDGTTKLNAGYGEYFAEPKRAFFRIHVEVVDSSSVITSDSLTYWRATHRSLATGHVRVQSPADRLTIYGGRLDHDAERLYSRMIVDPVMVQLDSASGGGFDTLQVRANVLEAFRDSTHRLIATDSVRMVRSDLAATCRYVCFYTRGDSMHLRNSPVIWYEKTQVSGDSMNVYLRKRKLQRLLVTGDAFAVSRSDSLRPERIDQLTGDSLTMHFGAEGLQRMEVEGRAISLYHLYDDSLANGLNKTSGDRIVTHFAEGKAQTITVYGGVEGQYFPENMVHAHEQDYALPGLKWRTNRPRQIPVVTGDFPTPDH